MGGDCIKTYEVQFIMNGGNGWALVNAKNASEVSLIMKNQSQYKNIHIVGIMEKEFIDLSTHIIYEGAVTTLGLPSVAVDENKVKSIIDSYSFVTKDYADSLIPSIGDILPVIDSNTKHWIINGIDTGIKAVGEDGKDGINGMQGEKGSTPYIDPVTKNWVVDNEDTGIRAEGIDGAQGEKGEKGDRGDSLAFEIVDGDLIVITNNNADFEIQDKNLIMIL